MTVTVSPEKMEQYRRAARKRDTEQQQAQAQRREVAWTAARQAASLLKDQFGASRVVVYGSLAHGAWFNARSDIDLMVVGIPPDQFWRAWAALDQIAGGFEIELVVETELTESLRKVIQREGVEL
jgi:predicted nucleotidyltransferase